MAAAANDNRWRRILAIGFLSFGALGLAGCDTGTDGEDGTEQEAPTGGEETTPPGENPTEGEIPAEQDGEQDDG